MMVCQKAAEAGGVPPELLQLLDKYQCFLLLGSVAPDLPAIWDKASDYLSKGLPGVHGHHWSDRFHDASTQADGKTPFKTNMVVEHVFANLNELADREADACLVWILGHIGHIVTDVVVHPVVALAKEQALQSGRYKDSDPVHQQIEIVIDCHTALQQKGYEIHGSHFLNWITDVRLPKNAGAFAQTMRLWANGIKAAFNEDADPTWWYETYEKALSAVNGVRIQFRGYTYPELKGISDVDKHEFFDSPLIPPHGAGLRAPFMPAIFDRAVANVRKFWIDAWKCRQAKTSLKGVIPDWNLNTGMNRDTKKENDLW
jgi:hypothetical protein